MVGCKKCPTDTHPGFFHAKGVSNVETDVQAKSVVVEASDTVPPQLMLEKLEKVGLSHSC
jgi:hypothetical protein